MSRVDNQRRLFLELMADLRPLWHHDPGQPYRLAKWLAKHRAGGRDRKLYRELAYTAWRTLPEIATLSADELVRHVASFAERSPATALFIDSFGSQFPLAPPQPTEILPDWLIEECPEALLPPHCESLLNRAPLWIRIQTEDTTPIKSEFVRLGIRFSPSSHLPHAWRIEGNANVQSTSAYEAGLFEIQDIGSQALLPTLPIRFAGHWLDACAGAGGKTLQLAGLLEKSGHVSAHDIRVAPLQELTKRAQRAGLNNIEIMPEPSGLFDGVLVDAPCTGSGTWRRSPHLKWTTSREVITGASVQQRTLLDQFSAHVRTGGLLVYATCSLCRSENQKVVASFIDSHSDFIPEPILSPLTQKQLPDGQFNLMPADLDSDAYFVAAFRRKIS